MPQNKILYNVQDLYVGPANDTLALILPGQHLLQRMYRIQSFSYNVGLNRSNSQELGSRGTLNLPVVSSPNVEFSFDYLQIGVANEVRMGLNANWNLTGQAPVYVNNTGVSLISGFSNSTRTLDKRNFYVTINQSGSDAHAYYIPFFATGASGFSLESFIDPYSKNYHVLAFVNSYLSNITYNGNVGDFPSAKVKYVADNIVYYLSGSGIPVPIASPTSPTGLFSTYRAVVPKNYNDGLPSALRPGDINFSLSSTGYGSDIADLGFKIQDAKLQSYSIDINLQRQKLEYLGNCFPLDRPINYPVFANISLDFIVGDLNSGRLDNLFNRDYEYDASISIRNSKFIPISGQTTAILMDIKRARLSSFDYGFSLSQSKSVTLNLQTELNPDDLTRGVFISGIIPSLFVGGGNQSTSNTSPDIIGNNPTGTPINVIVITNELITEDGLDIIITETTNEPISAEDVIYTPGTF